MGIAPFLGCSCESNIRQLVVGDFVICFGILCKDFEALINWNNDRGRISIIKIPEDAAE
jgi:hypothetical protein